jgi:hypothetical protein
MNETILGAIIGLFGIIIGSVLTFFFQWFYQFRKNVIYRCTIGFIIQNEKSIDTLSITIVNKGFVPITIKSSGLLAPDKERITIIRNALGEVEFYKKKIDTSDSFEIIIEIEKIKDFIRKYNYKLKYFLEDSEGKVYKRKLNKYIVRNILK